jgi:hypothetical protein
MLERRNATILYASMRLVFRTAARRRSKTVFATCCATAAGSSCSQQRMTTQSVSRSLRSVSASRALLRAIFPGQYQVLDPGRGLPWSAQPCQKQPSINTATRVGPNTMSARRRSSFSGGASTRYLNPMACRRRRTASSGAVSRVRCNCILLRTPAEDAKEVASEAFCAVLRRAGVRSFMAARRASWKASLSRLRGHFGTNDHAISRLLLAVNTPSRSPSAAAWASKGGTAFPTCR